jgi:membrane-associated phospholipid phosphatase
LAVAEVVALQTVHEKGAVWDGAKMLTGEREAITTRPVEASRARGIRTPHRLPKGYLLLITVYFVIIGLFMFFHGGFIGPDTFLVFVALAALILGQSRTFLRDWTPFVILFFSWQMLRGYADEIAANGGFAPHAADVLVAERGLFGGYIPTVVLQHAFYTPGGVHWYDVLATAFWAFHFVLPLLFAFLLWLRSRPLYKRFVTALLTLSFAGFLTYILFPAVPPWLAASLNWNLIADPVHLIRLDVTTALHMGSSVSWILEHGNPNDIASMPSLHAAFPTLVFLFCLVYWRPLAPLALVYCFGLWFSVVYIGDHYVVDVLAGILYAVITFSILEVGYRLDWKQVRSAVVRAFNGPDKRVMVRPHASGVED